MGFRIARTAPTAPASSVRPPIRAASISTSPPEETPPPLQDGRPATLSLLLLIPLRESSRPAMHHDHGTHDVAPSAAVLSLSTRRAPTSRGVNTSEPPPPSPSRRSPAPTTRSRP